jgi:outer membrane protein TolC
VERDGLAVELAQKEYKPDFSLLASYMNRGGLDPMWQAGMAVSVPLQRKRLSAGLAEAEAQRRSSQLFAESIALQLRFRTQERLAQLRALETVAELYEKGIVPQDRLSFESALASYQAGKLPFITVLEALITLYRDRATQLRLLADHARGRASLEEASLESGTGMSTAAGGMGSRAAPTLGAAMGSAGSMSGR